VSWIALWGGGVGVGGGGLVGTLFIFCLFLRGGGRKGDVGGVIEIVSESFAEVEALKFGVDDRRSW
jgi:hypothetical protein